MTSPVKVGVVGAGNISSTYLENMTSFPDLEVVFVADMILDRAESQAKKYGVPGYGTVAELLAVEGLEIVVNITTPDSHFEISSQAIAAGKHVWSEKPLALDSESGAQLLALAKEAGVNLTCAPDTILGAGIQTALRAIARGDIGEPLTAITLFHVPGPESWHPSPEFLYAKGAGPLFDMGPYYLTTLVHALGAVTAVTATSSKAQDTRVIGSGPKAGKEFAVEVPTHYSALLEFEGGKSAQSTFSFQSALARAGFVEINGTKGTIVLPDPNMFDGEVTLWRLGSEEGEVLPTEGSTYGRGSGVLDLARAIRSGAKPYAAGEIASHVVDVMVAIADSAQAKQKVDVASSVSRPAPLEVDWNPAQATL